MYTFWYFSEDLLAFYIQGLFELEERRWKARRQVLRATVHQKEMRIQRNIDKIMRTQDENIIGFTSASLRVD